MVHKKRKPALSLGKEKMLGKIQTLQVWPVKGTWGSAAIPWEDKMLAKMDILRIWPVKGIRGNAPILLK